MIGDLPKSVEISGELYDIRTDYRDILTILIAFNDPELEKKEKLFVCLYILYPDFENIPQDVYAEAYEKAVWFIDCGRSPKDSHKAKVMDWEQDEQILFPAINSVAGFEIRGCEYLHWWTFMGYFMEIKDGVFSQVLHLRQKKSKNKKLEKWEQEFWAANKDICVLSAKLTEEEKEARENLNKLLG